MVRRLSSLAMLVFLFTCARSTRPTCTLDGDCGHGEVCAEVQSEEGTYRACAIPCTLPEGQSMSSLGCPAGMACWALEGAPGTATHRAVCVPAQHRRGLGR
ncbi:MAG: hypothetical protein AB1938_16935 [Myxococcota bacterium]